MKGRIIKVGMLMVLFGFIVEDASAQRRARRRTETTTEQQQQQQENNNTRAKRQAHAVHKENFEVTRQRWQARDYAPQNEHNN